MENIPDWNYEFSFFSAMCGLFLKRDSPGKGNDTIWSAIPMHVSLGLARMDSVLEDLKVSSLLVVSPTHSFPVSQAHKTSFCVPASSGSCSPAICKLKVEINTKIMPAPTPSNLEKEENVKLVGVFGQNRSYLTICSMSDHISVKEPLLIWCV